MKRIVFSIASAVLLLASSVFAQEQGPAGATTEPPVWKASELGEFIASRMVAPSWVDVEGDAAAYGGVEPAELRLQLQVIEAHAVGQALKQPFQAEVARDAFMSFFKKRYPPEEQEPIRLGLQMWGIAYSGAVGLGDGDEAVTLGHIRRVFGNSLEIEQTEELSGRGVALWSKTLSEAIAICTSAQRQAIVVAN